MAFRSAVSFKRPLLVLSAACFALAASSCASSSVEGSSPRPNTSSPASSSLSSSPPATLPDLPPDISLQPGSSLPAEADEQFVGLSETAANQLAASLGLMVRVAGRDGEYFTMTADYSPSRVSFMIEDDMVVSAQMG